MSIPFNKPYMTGKELLYIAEAHSNGMLAGDGPFSKRCHSWLEARFKTPRSLLTHSCTAALEMSALLLDIQPGDEVIMPSYTFVSTANAFVLRGGVPVFVDVREDTLNIDEQLIEEAITKKTRAIVPVHYAGVACEMDKIMSIAQHYGLKVVEDAAQGVMATYKGRALGTIGDLGAFSFHETKNLIAGEGGAILVNNPEMILRAEVIREKGTNRSQYFRGEVDKYTWREPGSSFLPGEITAAFLWAQFEEAEFITKNRLASWQYYYDSTADLERQGRIKRPSIPQNCQHNAHMFYIRLSQYINREKILFSLKEDGVNAVFHYVPLHLSPAGRRYGRVSGELPVTCQAGEQLIRLPMWMNISTDQQKMVVSSLSKAIGTV